ncbi:hypothetical protein [Spirosoma fluminis]
MNPTSFAALFITNFTLLSIFQRGAAVDAPVPGVDPQWFKSIVGAGIITLGQYVADNALAAKSRS